MIQDRFLVPVAGGEVGEPELAQARRHHREVARTLGLGSEPRSPRRSLTGSPRASLSSLASPLKGKGTALKNKGGKLTRAVSTKLERHDAEPDPSELLEGDAAVSVLEGSSASIVSIQREAEEKPRRSLGEYCCSHTHLKMK